MSTAEKSAHFRCEVGALRDTHVRLLRIASKVGGGSLTPTQGGEHGR